MRQSGTAHGRQALTKSELCCRLFIDQPVGVGFSHGTTTVGTSQEAASDVWEFLQIFFSDSRFYPTTTSGTYTQTAHTRSGSDTYTPSGTYSSGFTSTATPTSSSLRRPQTSPRSPLSSVRNIVAAWKERTPSLGKSVRSAATSPSPTQGDGLFSVRRRAERGTARLRDRALGAVDEHGRQIDGGGAEGEGAGDAGMSTSGDATTLSTSGMLPATFDIEELGQYASAGGTREVSCRFGLGGPFPPHLILSIIPTHFALAFTFMFPCRVFRFR